MRERRATFFALLAAFVCDLAEVLPGLRTGFFAALRICVLAPGAVLVVFRVVGFFVAAPFVFVAATFFVVFFFGDGIPASSSVLSL